LFACLPPKLTYLPLITSFFFFEWGSWVVDERLTRGRIWRQTPKAFDDAMAQGPRKTFVSPGDESQ
jgi:hypothetical protein